jgi:hypothetical protein
MRPIVFIFYEARNTSYAALFAGFAAVFCVAPEANVVVVPGMEEVVAFGQGVD